MRTELPECKRCCFCLPLRYGLITWGYIKLITETIFSIALIVSLCDVIQKSFVYQSPANADNIIFISIVLTLTLTDGALTTVFIIGGHKKNVKLLRVYYIYSLVIWGLTILLVLVCSLLIMPISPSSMSTLRLYFLIIDLATSFVNIIMQSYFILLLRSEIAKLNNSCEFRFVNNAAEAECTMKYKEGMPEEENDDICEKGTEAIYDKEQRDLCEKLNEKNLTYGVIIE